MTEPPVININPKPGKVQAMEVMLLVNGVLNIILGISLITGAFSSFLGVLCLPLSILPAVLGVFEVIYGYRMISQKPVKSKDLKVIAICEIVSILYGNVISMVVGILNLAFLDENQVKQYLE